MTSNPGARRLVLSAVGLLCALSLAAATYQPGSDIDLARRAPVIVRATVVSQEARLETLGGKRRPFTYVTLARLEAIRGDVEEAFTVRLPGGRVGDFVSWTAGTPRFAVGSEVVLFLERSAGAARTYRLSEFGLSKFDLVSDGEGKRFAVRSAFGRRQDLILADRGDVLGALAEKRSVPARDADSFLSVLRALAAGRETGDIEWREPAEGKKDGHLRRKWVNIAGREPGDCGGGDPCLFRWFWSDGNSPDGVVAVTGTQTNLTNDDAAGCGTDSLCDVQHAIDEWHGVAGSDVRYSGISQAGNVAVMLDALQDHQGGAAWTTALGCGAGVIGLGGPSEAFGPRTYRGDGNYFAPREGNVSMRKVTCAQGYSARTFKTALMHELGHSLGLGHPDDDGTGQPVESIHSSTSPASWDTAVMTSVVPDNKPDTPQADDIQAIQFYYTTGSLGTNPTANFTFSPATPVAGAPVAFTDTTTGNPVGWNWNFGDPSSGGNNVSMSRNPSHTFSAPGTYTVSLTAGSSTGTGTTTRQVTVGQGTGGCTPSASTLCLNNNRFSVTANFRTLQGQTGAATGVELTSDSGYFYFFNAANIEIVIKVLSGCGLNNHYWVFAAGLTNVEVDLRVTDTQNGTVKNYFNPIETPFAPVQDTSAFETCP
jgi:PKD repeat protein